MGYNCCGPEQPDGQDNRIDIMREYTPGIKKHHIKKSKTEAEVSINDFIIPANKIKRNNYSKHSKFSNGSRYFKPENDDPYRLDTLNSKNLNQLVKL